MWLTDVSLLKHRVRWRKSGNESKGQNKNTPNPNIAI